MRKNIVGYLIGTVFIIVGIGFIWNVIYTLTDEQNFTKTAIEGEGTIIKISIGTSFQGGMGSAGGKPVPSYTPRIRFETSDGKNIEFVGATSSLPGWRVGQTIPILYNPNNPNGARIKTNKLPITIFSIVFPVVGSFLLLIGILIVFVSPIYNLYKKRKEQNKLI
jgi:Protein of unknown function (DUF3592)